MRKFKILFLVDKLRLAGAQKHLLNVILGLDKSKFEARLVTLEDLAIVKIYGLSGIRGLFKLISIIKQQKFDIVHSYLFSENILGAIAAKISGVKTIITGRRDTGMLREGRWYHILAYRITNRWVDKIICVSNAVKKVAKEKERVPEEKLEVIYNGVATGYRLQATGFRQQLKQSLGINEDEKVVGMVANFSWIKGHKDFVEAAALVLKEVPNMKFVLVGNGPLLDSCRLQAASLKIEDKLLFLGSRQDVGELLSIMDVSVNASYSEGMSNTILESMAAGVPVVATAADGNVETVIGFDGENIENATGILVPVHNPQEMARAIIRVLKDEKLRQHLSENSERIAADKFSLNNMIISMQNEYLKLLKPRIAYIMSKFPSYDETFIMREIIALKDVGYNLDVFSLKSAEDKVFHESARALKENTFYSPFLLSIGLISANVGFLFLHPIRYIGSIFYVLFGVLTDTSYKRLQVFLKTIAVLPKSAYFARIMLRRKISHIHSHWSTYPTTVALFISRLTNIPFSFTAHAHDIFRDRVMLKEKLRQTKFVATCTADNKKYLIKLLDNREEENKIIVNYHGVDFSKFETVTVESNHRPFTILSVGTLNSAKGFEYLIDACKILKEKGLVFEGIIAGGGALEKELKERVKSKGLEGTLHFTGYI